MMKKITALLVLALTTFTMTACSSAKVEEQAVDEYVKAEKTTREVTSADFEAKLLVDANDSNMHVKVALDGSFLNQDKTQVQAALDVAANGVKIEDIAKVYVKDDIVYMNALDTKKLSTPVQTFKDIMEIPATRSTTAEDLERYLSTFSMKEEDGKKVLEGEFNEDFTKNIKTYADRYLEETTAKNMTIEKVNSTTLKVVIDKKGYIEEFVYLIDVIYKDSTAEKGKETIPTELTLSFKLNDIDQVESIDFPDFKDYKESKGDLTTLFDDLSTESHTAV